VKSIELDKAALTIKADEDAIDKSKKRIADLEAQLKALQVQLAGLSGNKSELSDTLKKLQDANDALLADVTKLKADLAAKEKLIKDAENENKRLADEAERRRQNGASAEDDAAALRAQLEAALAKQRALEAAKLEAEKRAAAEKDAAAKAKRDAEKEKENSVVKKEVKFEPKPIIMKEPVEKPPPPPKKIITTTRSKNKKMDEQWAAMLIVARFKGMMARTKARTRLKQVTHLCEIEIKSATGLASSDAFMRPVPDSYILTNALGHGASAGSLKKKRGDKEKDKCYSTAKTEVILQNYNPQYHEDIRLSMVGNCNVVFNVFSQSQNGFAGDAYMGQCVLDLTKYPNLYSNDRVEITLPLSVPALPVFDDKGNKLTVSPTIAPQGNVNICARVPSVFSNMCGWFTDIITDLFGVIKGEKIWAVLCNGEIYAYDSPFEGTLKYQFSCKEISRVEEVMSDKLEIKIECIEITLLQKEGEPFAKTYTWAWAKDSGKYKALWRTALVKNHGSGRVSTKTMKAIDKAATEEKMAAMDARIGGNKPV
jgi:hypothetical protein